MIRSIRARTLLLVLALLGLSLSLISYKSYRDALHEVEELFDARLAQSARLLAGMLGPELPGEARNALQAALDEAASLQDLRLRAQAPGHEYESKLGFIVFDAQGHSLLRSAGAPAGDPQQLLGRPLQYVAADGLVESDNSLLGYHSRTLGEHSWRLFLLRDLRDGLWVLVAEREDVRGEMAGKIARRSLQPDLIGLPLLALLVWLAIGWGLQPLARMARQLKQRDPDSLAPLPETQLPGELRPLVQALNHLLYQLTELLGREKRFIADAAHELRTPLAVLRIHAQNAQTCSDDAERAAALQHIGSGVERATRVVAQLLTLARLEPGAAELKPALFDLRAFVRQELAELTPLALEHDQELTLEADEQADLQLLADAPSLGVLLQNLVVNAIQHTPAGGSIQVHLQALPSELQLNVLDSGPGVEPALRARLFERFFRQGPGQGAGLGLSIVARVVELHRGRIELLDSPLGGLQVRVSLPRRPAAAAPPGRLSAPESGCS